MPLSRQDAAIGEDGIPVKLGLTAIALAALLTTSLTLSQAALAQQQQPPVPDAPTPQPHPPLNGAEGTITPGLGAGDVTSNSASSSTEGAPQNAAPSSQAPSAQGKDEFQTTPPEMPMAGQGMSALPHFVVNVNFVEVPVTVKDAKGKLVAGLTFRDFKVFENGIREPLRLFTVDPAPLSIAFVIDQSLTSDVMAKVNNSLGAIQGALTPYDEVAVFSYNNGAQERTGFTGAQSARLPAVLALTKETGTEELVPVNSGPLAGCNVHVNGNCADPNLSPAGRPAAARLSPSPKKFTPSTTPSWPPPRSCPPVPRAAAASSTSSPTARNTAARPPTKRCCSYLQTNKIAVYGTAVGDSARWGEGYVSRFHLPFTMYDNILYSYISRLAARSTPSAASTALKRAMPRSPRRRAPSTRWAT